MNVYFIATDYIKEDAFEYLMKVLKVNAVFSFIDIDEMSDTLKAQLGNKLTQYNRYLKKGEDVNAFIKKCVTCISSLAVRTHKVDGRFEQVDLDSFKDSRFNNPIHNLLKTEDNNVLLLCYMYEMEISNLLSIPIFHGVIKEREYRSARGYNSVYYIDASHELSSYVYNRLRKILNDDKYRDRICFFRFGKDEEELFFRNKWGVPIRKTSDGRSVKRSFYKYIIKELHSAFPDRFPCIKKDGKTYYATFYDRNLIRQENSYYQPEPEDYNDPYEGYGSFENWALMEAYDGDPSLMWNND